jgi:peroxiredoxin/predicted 2-oxoglutarate/Fe(II)-dependent dioxygenase YbiX
MQSASSPAGIQVGDLLPPFEAMTADGRPINLDGDALAGRPRLLVFVRDAEAPAVEAALQRLTAWADHLAHLDCRVFVALPLPPASAKAKAAALGLPFTILCDPDLKAARALTPAVLQASGPPLASLLLRPGRQVQAVLGAETEDHGDVACAYVEKLAPERAWQVQTGQQAPVLLLPDAFSPADCQRLLTVFAMQGNEFVEPGHGIKGRTADYKMRIPDYGRNDRVDHWVINQDTTQFIAQRLFARVAPVVQRAFQYKLSRYERFRIGRYEASDDAKGIIGAAHGHRDNVEPQVAHRRFACSVNLNAEAHEGGGLVFPEFSGTEYAPRTGEALVFSSSLLHQVMPVRQGTRFTLLSFLFGES